MRAVCIDDERLALDFMTHLLDRVEHIQLLGTFQQAKEGLDFILKEAVDVVFLDIQMPEINGLQLAEKILTKKPAIDIVFVTAYNEYAVNAFELNAIDYLMKPVKLERLQKTIERLKKERGTVKEKEEKSTQLYIKLGNNVSFSTENKAFEPVKWRTSKARELFLYLLQNKGTLIHKGSLMETLWGEEDLDRGYSILYTTVYNVRKALQTYADHIKLKNTNDGYMLSLEHVQVDLQEWEQQLRDLPGEVTEESIDEYMHVMDLNSGPYLAEYDYIWIESEKQRLETMWIAAMQKIIDYYRESNQITETIQLLQQLVARVPELEEGHLLLMEIYAEQNNAHLVNEQYDEYVSVQHSYGLRPSPKIQKWYTDYIEDL